MSGETGLDVGDLLPHFTVPTLEGDVFSYSSIWQRKNLLLVVLKSDEPQDASAFVQSVNALTPDFDALDAVCVVTRAPIEGLRAPAVLVADRWGEVVHVAPIPERAGGPDAADLREWLEHVAHRCPECEGEAR